MHDEQNIKFSISYITCQYISRGCGLIVVVFLTACIVSGKQIHIQCLLIIDSFCL